MKRYGEAFVGPATDFPAPGLNSSLNVGTIIKNGGTKRNAGGRAVATASQSLVEYSTCERLWIKCVRLMDAIGETAADLLAASSDQQRRALGLKGGSLKYVLVERAHAFGIAQTRSRSYQNRARPLAPTKTLNAGENTYD